MEKSPATPAERELYLKAAKTAHDMNRLYCVEINDPVQAPWDMLPEQKIESLLIGVAGIVAGNTPELSHALWSMTHKQMGWTLGPVRDEEKKEHPNLRPYAELPLQQRLKDTLFRTVVLGVLAANGLTLEDPAKDGV